jgi:hypothetical protein
MKQNLYIILAIFFINNISAQSTKIESIKLVNDLNKSEKRDAIYMCEEVNYTWEDFLKEDPKASKYEKEKYLKRIATLKAYLGDDKLVWLKNIPKINSWKGIIEAKEFVNVQTFDVDSFYKTHKNTGVYFYSEPLFSNDKKKAIVYIWYISGRLGINAIFYYCEKTDGVWKKMNPIIDLGGFVS